MFSGCDIDTGEAVVGPVEPPPIQVEEPAADEAEAEVPDLPVIETDQEMEERENNENAEAAENEAGEEPEDPAENEVPDEPAPPEQPQDPEEPAEPDDPAAPGDGTGDPNEGECVDTAECPAGLLCSVIYGDCFMEEGDEECRGICVPEQDDGGWPEEPDMGDCAETAECAGGEVCTTIYGDCFFHEGDERCFGFCVPEDEGDIGWAEDPECADAAECDEGLICTTIYGDCFLREGDDQCYGFCIDEAAGDPCIGDPDDPENPDNLCEEPPPPPGCGPGEDPCEAAFQACLEAIEEGVGVFAELDAEWCADERDACEEIGDGGGWCPGDEEFDMEAMCEETLEWCIEGLDSQNEQDQPIIALCYEDLQVCKDMAQEMERFDNPICREPYDACLEAAVQDADFMRCDEALQACADGLAQAEAQGNQEAPPAENPPAENP